jgi:hypothetical protein
MSMAKLCRYLCIVNVKLAKLGWPATAAINGVMMSATCSTNTNLHVTHDVCGGSLHRTCTNQVATRLEIYRNIRRQHIVAQCVLKQSHSSRFFLSFPKWVRRAHHSINQVESGSSDHDSHSQVNNLNVTPITLKNHFKTRREVAFTCGREQLQQALGCSTALLQSLSDQLRVHRRLCTQPMVCQIWKIPFLSTESLETPRHCCPCSLRPQPLLSAAGQGPA